MRRSPGFTLIEVMVALTIGGIVVLMVHDAFAGATDLASRLEAERRPHAARMSAAAYLTRAFASLDIGTPGSRGFDGTPDQVSFSAALDPGRASELVLRAGEGLLTVATRDGPVTPLDSVDGVRFEYLLSFGSDATWVTAWHSPASAPLAVRMRLTRPDGTRDTLLFVIGPRG